MTKDDPPMRRSPIDSEQLRRVMAFSLSAVIRAAVRIREPHPVILGRNRNPEPLLGVMKVVLKGKSRVRCRRPPAEYLLP